MKKYDFENKIKRDWFMSPDNVAAESNGINYEEKYHGSNFKNEYLRFEGLEVVNAQTFYNLLNSLKKYQYITIEKGINLKGEHKLILKLSDDMYFNMSIELKTLTSEYEPIAELTKAKFSTEYILRFLKTFQLYKSKEFETELKISFNNDTPLYLECKGEALILAPRVD